MLPRRLVRSFSHDDHNDYDEANDDNDFVDDAEDVNPNHLDQKLLYEILCHRVDVTRPVNLATDVGFDDYHLF